MGIVLLSLLPASGYGIWHFGVNAAILIVVSVAACVLTELVYELIMKQPVTIGDLSAAVTGLLLALNMPPTAAWWLPVIGGVFAIVFVRLVKLVLKAVHFSHIVVKFRLGGIIFLVYQSLVHTFGFGEIVHQPVALAHLEIAAVLFRLVRRDFVVGLFVFLQCSDILLLVEKVISFLG